VTDGGVIRAGTRVRHRQTGQEGSVVEVVPFGVEDINWTMYQVDWDHLDSSPDYVYYSDEIWII
jgi:hypothetical protein